MKFSQAPSKHTSRLSLEWCPNMVFLNTVHEQIKVEPFFSWLEGLVARLRFCSTGCRLPGNFARAKICYHKWYPTATQPLRVFAKVVVARCFVSLLVNYTCYELLRLEMQMHPNDRSVAAVLITGIAWYCCFPHNSCQVCQKRHDNISPWLTANTVWHFGSSRLKR